MMLKNFRCLVLAMVLILVVFSCTTFAAKKPVKIIFGHNWNTELYYAKGIDYFKKLVEKNSKGKILVEVFPGSQLGGPGELLQATKNGAQQMTGSALGGYISGLWPKLATFELPWLVDDYARASRIAEKFDSLIDPEELVAKTGVRGLGVFISSLRHLTSRKVPIKDLEDIKGLKVRVPEIPSFVAMWKALGAVPTVITNTEMYTALATGTVDAQESGLSLICSYKLYEQLKYCTLTAHQCGMYIMNINNNFWNSLTTKQKKIIQDAADKCSKFINKATIEDDKKCYRLLVKAGMKFNKIDRVPLMKKGKTIWRQFGDVELIKKVEAIK
jgi:tripartite ATP-independent transporter DctP family solute receptor